MGARKVKTFSSPEKAELHARSVGSTIAKGDARVLTLTDQNRLVYLRAAEALMAFPGTQLDHVVTEYLEARKILGDHSVMEAARFFKKTCGDIQPRTIRQVVDELIAVRVQRTKQGKPASQKYLADISHRLGKLAADFTGPISSMTPPLLDAWVTGKKLTGRTRHNYLRLIKTLFKFAQSKRYFPRDVDPLEGVETDFVDESERV